METAEIIVYKICKIRLLDCFNVYSIIFGTGIRELYAYFDYLFFSFRE